eukprot:2239529-Rhodomonas_salina.3
MAAVALPLLSGVISSSVLMIVCPACVACSSSSRRHPTTAQTTIHNALSISAALPQTRQHIPPRAPADRSSDAAAALCAGAEKDLLCLTTERWKFCVLEYDNENGELLTKAMGDVQDRESDADVESVRASKERV